MTINVGDKEIVFREDSGSLVVFEITYTELDKRGHHKAVSSDGHEVLRNATDGMSMSGYVTFSCKGKSYEGLYRKKGVEKEPDWLRNFGYYAFCQEHKRFYRTDCTYGCFDCNSQNAKQMPKTLATKW